MPIYGDQYTNSGRHFVHEHRDGHAADVGRDFPYKLPISRRGMELVGAAAPS